MCLPPMAMCGVEARATQEGYSGASAWYGNYDSRVSTLKQNFTEEQMDTYFPGLNDEQITETLQAFRNRGCSRCSWNVLS